MLSCSLISTSNSLHLGEAPGGFVQATSQVAPDDWTWNAVSLNIEGSPKAMLEHLPMKCGNFLNDLPFEGDLLREECAQEVLKRLSCKAGFVTADGAVEMNHDRLEQDHVDLLFAQTKVALSALSTGGTYVCKFFEGSMFKTVLWIALMTNRFEFVSIIKPKWSRPTNSERYLVCKQFSGDDSPLPMDGFVSKLWYDDTKKILDRLCEEQSSALERALTSLRNNAATSTTSSS